MKQAWIFALTVLFCSLAACTDEQLQSEAAKQAEATEASMDAEAARMVAAADSVRAAGEHTADSLRAHPTSQAKPRRRQPRPLPVKPR